MSEKTLKFGDVEVNKKNLRKIHASKQPIALNLVDIVISHSDKAFKYFIGYNNDDVIRPLCVTLPQMNGCIKYFDNSGKNMSFKIE